MDRKFDVVMSLLLCALMMFFSAKAMILCFCLSLIALFFFLVSTFGIYIIVRDYPKMAIAA